MIHFQNTLVIHRHPEVVFEYLSKLENLPRWNYAILDTVKYSGVGHESANNTYIVTRKLFGRGVTEMFKVNELLREEKIQIESIKNSGPFHYKITYFLEKEKEKEKEKPNTVLTNDVELASFGTFHLFDKFAVGKIKNEVRHNLNVLKSILE